ncbi:unnamed protein product, partial [Urochloa humidicola]
CHFVSVTSSSVRRPRLRFQTREQRQRQIPWEIRSRILLRKRKLCSFLPPQANPAAALAPPPGLDKVWDFLK